MQTLATRSIVSLAVGLVAASISAAAILPYRVLVADFGGGQGALGKPITWSGPGDGRSYTNASGSFFAPSADDIDSVPRLRWDNYFMFDPNGASFGGNPDQQGDGYSALNPSGSFFLSFSAGQVAGVTYHVGGHNGGRHAGPDGRLFLLNLTLPAASSAPTTAGVYLSIAEQSTAIYPESQFYGFRFGAENAVYGTMFPSRRRYYLDWIATPVPASELPASFGPGMNYQVFIQQEYESLPGPGVGLLGVAAACFAAPRRRRDSTTA